MAKSDFNQASYWQTRVSGDLDLGKVGHRSLGRGYNEYIYRRRVEVLLSTLNSLCIEICRERVLEIGCGSGFYVDLWKQLGVLNLVGIDISPDSIKALTARFPHYQFLEADVSADWPTSLSGRDFNLITVFDVFYHIIDDGAVLRAFQNASRALSASGYILVFEQLQNTNYHLRRHVRFRGREAYRAMLKLSGLEIVDTIPLFILLEPPVVGIKVIDVLISGAYWILGLPMRFSDRIGRFVGKATYSIDQILFRKGIRAPNHVLLVLKKRTDLPGAAELANTKRASPG
jgi:SAM-dependent methyltransferase